MIGARFLAWAGVSLNTTFKIALGPTERPTQWVPWALSMKVKRPKGEARHLTPT